MYFVVICIYCHIHVYAGIYIFTYDACKYLGSEEVLPDQYQVETVALAGRNFNVPCVFMALIQRYASVL